MAYVFPSLDNIKKLKVPPTEGEWYLLNYLIKTMPDDIEIYFRSFFNGDMPDIIMMQKNIGVTIIEIKDWDLDLYYVDEKNKWYLKKENQILRSPFQQVFNYKDNMFNLHITGLLEKKIKNKTFYGRIQTYVYFHNASKNKLNNFYYDVFNKYKSLEQELHNSFKNKKIKFEQYERKLEYIKNKKKKITRDLHYLAVSNDDLKKIKLPNKSSNLFTENIYNEFKRLLQPPYHIAKQGIYINYNEQQKKLIESKVVCQKVIGITGSGKTTVLAKRAVNALKRHDDKVLILTYNITLKNYIHDRINEVREGFSWENFYINNYHNFIIQELNNLNIEFIIPDKIKAKINNIENVEDRDKGIDEYFEKAYFSNIKLFRKHSYKITRKYKTILIDEVQDYKPDWIKILKEFYTEKEYEIVLFGDAKQNIYHREVGKKERLPVIVKGFGEWQKLTKVIRYEIWDSKLVLPLIKAYQKEFLSQKYDLDDIKIKSNTLIDDKNKTLFEIKYYEQNKYDDIANTIISKIKEYNIHNDDIVILASKIHILQKIDQRIRNKYNLKTITTFETLEDREEYKIEMKDIRKNKKIAFTHHSKNKIKISTIHSFKGYDSAVVFLIIDENNKNKDLDDNDEVVYTGITRAKRDLMVFTIKDSKYKSFFKKHLKHQ